MRPAGIPPFAPFPEYREEPTPHSTNSCRCVRQGPANSAVSTDDLQPALRTTLQLLGELGICSRDSTAQVPEDASAQVLCLLEELRDLTAKKDLELHRCGVHLPLPLSLSSLSFQLGCWGWNPTQLASQVKAGSVWTASFWGLCCECLTAATLPKWPGCVTAALVTGSHWSASGLLLSSEQPTNFSAVSPGDRGNLTWAPQFAQHMLNIFQIQSQ